MLTNDDLAKIKLLVTGGNSPVLKEIDEVKEKIENVESQINSLLRRCLARLLARLRL